MSHEDSRTGHLSNVTVSVDGPPEQAGPAADEGIVSQLLDIGFPRVRCEKAAIQTLNNGLEEAMNWLLAHMDDPGWACIWFFALWKNLFRSIHPKSAL
jgi:hypothetical protein